jgi:CheY-like chemotaxis protein
MQETGAAAPPPLSVLLVDDEKHIRVTPRMCLQTIGAEVTEAASLEAGRAARVLGIDVSTLCRRRKRYDGS